MRTRKEQHSALLQDEKEEDDEFLVPSALTFHISAQLISNFDINYD